MTAAAIFLETKTFTPYSEWDFVYEVLDSITAAVEAGVVDRNRWVSQFFASREVFIEFMEEFNTYDECYRVVDRWYKALFEIANAVNEEGFVSCAEMVERLLEQAEESKQVVL
jgi:hypothetical protein